MNDEFPNLDYRIDTTKFDEEFEAQEIFLQQQYEERKKERENKDSKNITKEYSDIELEKIEKKAEYNAKIYLHDKYMYCYKSGIFHNDILGKCSLHYVLGSLLRHKQIEVGFQEWLDYRIHLILIQMSGTGKGKTANFIERVIRDVKYPIVNIKTNELLPCKKWRNADIITSGKTNDSALINTFIMDNKGCPKIDKNGIEMINKGSVELYDFFIYEEGGHLFNNSEGSNNMVDIFLRAMEPIGSSNNKIDKKLTQYSAALTTTSKSSFFFMTRPMGKMKKTVAESGLFQRCLFIPREIDDDIANNMKKLSASSKIKYGGGIRSKKDVNFYYDLIDEIKKVIEFGFNNNIVQNPRHTNDIDAFFESKIQWFYDDMRKNVINDDVRNILNSLSNRYIDNMLTMSYHSACMRYSTNVDLEDFQYSFNIMKELYEEQKNWLSNTLEVSYYEKKEKQEFKKVLYNLIKLDKNRLKTMDIIVNDLCKIFELDDFICRKKIITLSKGPLAIIEIKDSKIKIIS